MDCLGGMFTADLTNSPIRRQAPGEESDGSRGRVFDGILCDPPYGVREGLRVLGVRDPEKSPWVIPKGIEMYRSVATMLAKRESLHVRDEEGGN